MYLCGHYGLHEVAAYWQQHRISTLVVRRLFGTVTGKRIAVLGFAFKADTNDTRKTPAIRICRDLLEEGAQLAIFDPKVSPSRLLRIWGWRPLWVQRARACGSRLWILVTPFVERMLCCCSLSGSSSGSSIGRPWRRRCGSPLGCLMPGPWRMRRRRAQRGCGCGLWGRVRGRPGVLAPAGRGRGRMGHARRRRLEGKAVKARRPCMTVQPYYEGFGADSGSLP